MFYFMSKGDFTRIATVVEVINGNFLSNEDSQTILGWVNNCDHEQFDQFCLAVSDEWSDCYPQVSTTDYESIAEIIHDTLNGGM